jgi:transcriptional regulator with XRE-family HTH domain
MVCLLLIFGLMTNTPFLFEFKIVIMNYGKALKILRVHKGLEQNEFAKLMGISSSLLSRIEKGERALSHLKKEYVANKLGIPSSLIDILAIDNKNEQIFSEKEVADLGKILLEISDVL